MSARTVVAHALRVYYQDDRDPAGFVEQLLAKYDAELLAHTGEKSIPAGAPEPVADVATHRHPRPCEFPEVLPCRCVRPGRLPDSSFVCAKQLARVSGFFRCVALGRAAAADLRRAAA
ncbi:hypothetical protein [Streptomyces ardesiacus]|uniref:hypothetical protein n=1 Tax=Streptomyces ardesiacus TaxID=285564 RepID=UPI003641CD3B